DRFVKILRETIKDVRSAENLIVVQTLNGCANAAAEAMDSATSDEIVGTIAGDNTILIIVDTKEHVPDIVKKIKEIIS
ncbi:MAG: arginine repressor, partial [Firmicutes bacterium]|nr:arginine repressor [Bacillota bacterium]